MKKINILHLGLIALGFLIIAFFFELIVPIKQIRNIAGTISGAIIVLTVVYVIIFKMILKK